jgi:hypothetical protein
LTLFIHDASDAARIVKAAVRSMGVEESEAGAGVPRKMFNRGRPRRHVKGGRWLPPASIRELDAALIGRRGGHGQTERERRFQRFLIRF